MKHITSSPLVILVVVSLLAGGCSSSGENHGGSNQIAAGQTSTGGLTSADAGQGGNTQATGGVSVALSGSTGISSGGVSGATSATGGAAGDATTGVGGTSSGAQGGSANGGAAGSTNVGGAGTLSGGTTGVAGAGGVIGGTGGSTGVGTAGAAGNAAGGGSGAPASGGASSLFASGGLANTGGASTAPHCGNSVVESGETCDPPGSCPISCDDGNACTADQQTGSAATCNLACSHTVTITSCVSGDGCCPLGCNTNIDSDCSPTCGNGAVEHGETCDPPSACLANCNDGNACTVDQTTGSAANCNLACSHTAITACTSGDGCCPVGCNTNLDSDCSASCGNGAVESGETCDPPASCPASCNDGNACTIDQTTGSAANCNLACSHTAIAACTSGDGCCPAGCNANTDGDCSATCGNGVVESGETCDPDTSCPASCNDGNACTIDQTTGSAANCNLACSHSAITACASGDGCCPAGCNANNDGDCSASCGNGVVESGETCDPSGSCPASCDDGNACTVDQTTGSAANCNLVCSHTPITACASGDGCCPAGCTSSNDQDCAVPPCNPGEKRCTGQVLELCDGTGKFVTQQICGQTCDASTKQCLASTTCTAGTRICAGNIVEQCNATGSAYLAIANCLGSCADGHCTGTCTPGQKQCNGNVPESCNTAGTGYTPATACSNVCDRGICAAPNLTIDSDPNVTLDGDQVFDGDVVIRNTSTVRSATGVLRIKAKSVTLDVSSSLVIQPTGTNPLGQGQAGGSSTCSYSCYYSWCSCYYSYASDPLLVGGGGGGHGEAGTGTSKLFTPTSSSSCSTCSVTASGGPAYSRPDNDEATGSKGGDCSSGTAGHGGGLLVIEAETIIIDGTISAIGEAGTGCAGGGSGGMVILRASQNLTVTGAIWAQGGAGGGSVGGAGGRGVVKLLYGNAKTITGAVTAVTYQSLMPPQDLSSATHPDSARWYNDDYPSFDVAWSRPFPNVVGYYRSLNTTLAYVPKADAQSLYQTEESTQIAPASLVNGTNYFHIVSVGPNAVLGTVESRYPVQINTAVPSVTSSSHPSSTTWYDNPSAFVSWTLPGPATVADVRSFYWVLDRFKTTIPTKQSNVLAMNPADPSASQRLILPNNAQGVWFFHVLSEDSMGYLTKSAAHFQFQVGPTAGLGNGGLTGIVSQAGSPSTLLSGVSITLNRGMYNATTNSSGQYSWANDGLIVQSYEIRATKTAYRDYVGSVAIVNGQATILNFAMTPLGG